ncbi:MAG TPA: DUF2809 domain-containing protein [Bacteroidetes bacterium]|nr:DUF2809 domain-containing protein [Bacteroidota bacterium]
MILFNKKYFKVTLALLATEVFIGFFVKDGLVRPYVGDFLVVILIYCFIKSFWDISPLKAGIGVLVFSYAVEIGQYFKLVKLLGLSHSPLARTIIGTGFDPVDLVTYTLGIALVWGLEKKITATRPCRP